MNREEYFKEQRKISSITDDYVLDFIERKVSNSFYEINEPIVYGIKKRFNENPRMRGYFDYLLYNLLTGKEDHEPILPILGSHELYALSTYTLDDILDNQSIRDGGLSSHAKFGTNDAIISGIIQRNLAFEMLKELDVKPEIKLKIYETFEEGDKILYYGQLLNERMKEGTTLEEYLKVRKLISFEVRSYANIIGYFVSNNLEKEDKVKDIIEKSKKLGEYLGLFGMVGNDFMSFIPEIQEIKRSKAQFGKSFEDIRKGLWTFPFVHYFSLNKYEYNQDQERIRNILGNQKATDEGILDAISILIKAGSLKEHLKLVKRIRERAINYIKENFPENPCRDKLIGFFTYYVNGGPKYGELKHYLKKNKYL